MALNYGWDKLKGGFPLSLRLIRELHERLLNAVRGRDRTPGVFRTRQVHIGADRRFVPPPAQYLSKCLDDLEKYFHAQSSIDPLIRALMVHYQFETIHPFLDGNGRVGRLLLSLMIYEWTSITSPWLYLSAYFEEYKQDYIDNLFNVSASGKWDKWLEYCLRGVKLQAIDAIKRFDQLVELKDKYLKRVVEEGAHVRINKLLEYIFESPVITIPVWAEMAEISYPTASTDLRKLVEIGLLSETDGHHPKLYFGKEILQIVHSGLL